MRARRPRILVVAMYELGDATSGPEVRIRHMLAALGERAAVDVVAGHRPKRRAALARYALGGRLRGLDGVYVESSTALPSETDLAVLTLARSLGIPVLTYVRDAYQLFEEYYAADTWRRRASRRLFPIAMRGYRTASTRLAFPSRGLAEAVLGASAAGEAVLLPPGAPQPADVPVRAGARQLLFVGDTRVPAQGGVEMVQAVELARRAGPDVELLCVSRPGGEPPAPRPAWLRVERASSDEVARFLPDVIGSLITRRPGAYNDLAIPIKLMEYLSYGRPLLVTDRAETAAIVRRADAGIVMGDDPAQMADAIRRLVEAPDAQRNGWARAAAAAARANGWDRRAGQVLEALGLG